MLIDFLIPEAIKTNNSSRKYSKMFRRIFFALGFYIELLQIPGMLIPFFSVNFTDVLQKCYLIYT